MPNTTKVDKIQSSGFSETGEYKLETPNVPIEQVREQDNQRNQISSSAYRIGSETLQEIIENGGNFDKPEYVVEETENYKNSSTNLNNPIGDSGQLNIPSDFFKRKSFSNLNLNGTFVGAYDQSADRDAPEPFDGKFSDYAFINYKNTIKSERVNSKSTKNASPFLNLVETNSAAYNAYKYTNPSIKTIVQEFDEDQSQTSETTTKLKRTISPALKLSYNDFVYCKKLGSYPNNRLVIVRRFENPIPDDLINAQIGDVDQQPMAVMCTWYDEFPMSMNYSVKYTDQQANSIGDVFLDAFSRFTQGVGKTGKLVSSLQGNSNLSSDGKSGNPIVQSLFNEIIQNALGDDIENYDKVLPLYNPNLIRESVLQTGLTSEINIKLKFEYVLRKIGETDPHIAMHQLISNAIRMGTNTSIQRIPIKSRNSSLGGFTSAIEDISKGKVSSLIDQIQSTIGKIGSSLFDVVKLNSTNQEEGGEQAQELTNDERLIALDEILSDISVKALSVFRFELISAMQAETGLPSGSWHCTIGNPFDPVVSIGDLIPDGNFDIKFGKELSYKDFPTEFSVTVSLKTARSRGAQELEQIFNAGRGRIYVYPSNELDPAFYAKNEPIYQGFRERAETRDAASGAKSAVNTANQ